jgi:peptidoglycan hydrolase-like protein with peptidoglycan-binding domain
VSDRRLERRRESSRTLRRRPPTYNPLASSRPDRVAGWAFGLGLLLILLAATTSHGKTGGALAPGAAGPPAQGQAPQLGERLLSPGVSGSDVRTLQLILAARGYGPLPATGFFDGLTENAVKRFQHDAQLAVDGVVGPQTRPVLLRLMRVGTATWYGPGFYGKRTACGERLARGMLGVAHRSLPCGTPVTFYRAGRFVTVRVIDRGPFRRGVAWDLTAAAARAIGLRATTRLRSLH